MSDTLLALLLLIIGTLAAVGLALLVAEVLRGLALRNAAERQALVRDTRRQEQALAALRRELIPFRRLRAPQFNAAVAAAMAPLAEKGAAPAGALPAGLYFPTLPDGGLALGYLLQHPADGPRIVLTMFRLAGWRRRLAAARGHQARVREGVAALREMPARLAADGAALQTRLAAAHEALRAETESGVTTLAVARADAERLEKRLLAADEELTGNAPPLARQNAVAQELADATAALDRLEATIERVRGERAAFDEVVARAEAALAALARSQPPERRPRLLADLLAAAETWLAAAREKRGSADFAGGRALLERVESWLAYGEALATARAEIDWLLERRSASLQATAIDALEARLETALTRGAGLLAEAGGVPAADDASAATAPDGLADELRTIAAEAAAVRDRDEAAAERLSGAGARQMEALHAAWEELQALLPLAVDDPLARRYRAARGRWEAAAGSPALLQETLARADDVGRDIEESAWFLGERLKRAETMATDLPEQIGAAETMAGEWRCLAVELEAMQQEALAVQQRWLNWRHPGTLAEAHARLDELKLAYQRARTIRQGLAAGAAQLDRLAGIYDQTLAAIQNAPDLEPSRRLRLTAMARMHYGQAERDATLDEALESLRKAEGYLRELIVR